MMCFLPAKGRKSLVPILTHAGAAAVTALVFNSAVHAAVTINVVDRVTPTDNCKVNIDEINNDADLQLFAGTTRFELWNHFIDFASSISVQVDDNDAGTVTARIIQKRGGIENVSRGCENKGSAVVEVTSPQSATASLRRELVLVEGDTRHKQGINIKPITAIDATWQLAQGSMDCLVKTGSFVAENNNKRLVLQLPPGAATDNSNCSIPNHTTTVRVRTPSMPSVDVGGTYALREPVITVAQFQPPGTTKGTFVITGFVPVSNLPNLLTSDNGNNIGIRQVANLDGATTAKVTFNALNIRKLTKRTRITVAHTTPNGLTSPVEIEILPPAAANGFTQAAICRNQATGTTVNANDAFECELRLAIAPGSPGQTITFEARDRLCVASGAPNVNYSSATGIGTLVVSGSATIFQVPLRALAGNTSANTPCASDTGVAHVMKFWIGNRDAESGPDFTQTQFVIRQIQ